MYEPKIGELRYLVFTDSSNSPKISRMELIKISPQELTLQYESLDLDRPRRIKQQVVKGFDHDLPKTVADAIRRYQREQLGNVPVGFGGDDSEKRIERIVKAQRILDDFQAVADRVARPDAGRAW